MKYKIGVFGSAEGNFDLILNKAKELGKTLGEQNVIVITGATTGLPYEISLEAYKNGSEIWGFSAELGIKKLQERMPDHDTSIYKKLIYIPEDFPFASDIQISRKYRNVLSTANCDAGIIISGRWGTLNEFTNLYDMGKVIGILTGSGGIADELPKLSRKISKKNKAKVLFSDSPQKLIQDVIYELEKRV